MQDSVYRASDSRDKPADVLGELPVTPDLSARIRGGECPVCAAWADGGGQYNNPAQGE